MTTFAEMYGDFETKYGFSNQETLKEDEKIVLELNQRIRIVRELEAERSLLKRTTPACNLNGFPMVSNRGKIGALTQKINLRNKYIENLRRSL